MEWTNERIDALKKMWLDGMSASQVARQLGGVSRNAVIGKVHRMGLAGRDAPSRPHSRGGRPATRTRQKMAPSIRRSAKRMTTHPAPQQREAYDVQPSATILTLSEHACRWPIGDPDTAEFGFCGRAKAGHGSYCVGHTQVAFRAKPGRDSAVDPWGRRVASQAGSSRFVAS